MKRSLSSDILMRIYYFVLYIKLVEDISKGLG